MARVTSHHRVLTLLLLQLLAACCPTLVVANNWIPESAFLNDHNLVARSSAPKFFFQKGELCFPQQAEDGNGNQMPRTRDQCWKKPFASFPTYYLVRKCTFDGGVVRWRIVFDIYFPWSSTFDTYGSAVWWEYVVIGFSQVPEDRRYWRRENIILRNHPSMSTHIRKQWSDWPNTVYGSNPDNHIKNADHPVIYADVSVPDLRFFAVNGTGRTMEKKFFAPHNLRGAHYLNNNWNWNGKPAPATFNAGGSRDICNLL